MDQGEQRALVLEFEKNRQFLASVSSQKQQYSIQNEIIEESLKELAETKEDKVFKVVGNILVQKNVKDMKKELEEQKESVGLRLKTLEKQEETVIKKLNSIKAKVEGSEKKEDSGDSDKKEKKAKK